MKITHDLISSCESYVAPNLQRTLDMTRLKIKEIDNLSATLVN